MYQVLKRLPRLCDQVTRSNQGMLTSVGYFIINDMKIHHKVNLVEDDSLLKLLTYFELRQVSHEKFHLSQGRGCGVPIRKHLAAVLHHLRDKG